MWGKPSIDDIHDRESLSRYLEALARQVAQGEIPVENPQTADYIDAAGRWTASMDAYFANVHGTEAPSQPDWSMVAAILTAAVMYE